MYGGESDTIITTFLKHFSKIDESTLFNSFYTHGDQAPVVRKLDNVIQRVNLYPMGEH